MMPTFPNPKGQICIRVCQSLRVKDVTAVLFLFTLSSCGLSHGKCEIPASEAEIQKSMKVQYLSRNFRRFGIAESAENYLERNPECCHVSIKDGSWLSWPFWDHYSLPRYRARILFGFEAQGTIATYESFGLGDRCGRVPDPYGMEDIIAGPIVDPHQMRNPKLVPIAKVRELQKKAREAQRAKWL